MAANSVPIPIGIHDKLPRSALFQIDGEAVYIGRTGAVVQVGSLCSRPGDWISATGPERS